MKPSLRLFLFFLASIACSTARADQRGSCSAFDPGHPNGPTLTITPASATIYTCQSISFSVGIYDRDSLYVNGQWYSFNPPPSGFDSYWYDNGSYLSSGLGSFSNNTYTAASTSGSASVVFKEKNDPPLCGNGSVKDGPLQGTANITVIAPDVDIQGPQTVCPSTDPDSGTEYYASLAPASGGPPDVSNACADIVWTASGGGIVTTPNTPFCGGYCALVRWPHSGAKTVTATWDAGHKHKDYSVAVTQLLLDPIRDDSDEVGSAQVCIGQTITLSTQINTGCSGTIRWSNGMSDTGSITVGPWNSVGMRSVTANTDDDTKTFKIFVISPRLSPIRSDTAGPVCPGTSIQLCTDVEDCVDTPIAWTDNGVALNESGACASLTLTVPGPHIISASAGTSQQSFSITVLTPQLSAIAGPDSLCIGDQGEYSVSEMCGNGNVFWSSDSSATFENAQGDDCVVSWSTQGAHVLTATNGFLAVTKTIEVFGGTANIQLLTPQGGEQFVEGAVVELTSQTASGPCCEIGCVTYYGSKDGGQPIQVGASCSRPFAASFAFAVGHWTVYAQASTCNGTIQSIPVAFSVCESPGACDNYEVISPFDDFPDDPAPTASESEASTESTTGASGHPSWFGWEYLKGGVHIHWYDDNSYTGHPEGWYTRKPEIVAGFYNALGYRFIAETEHFHLTPPRSPVALDKEPFNDPSILGVSYRGTGTGGPLTNDFTWLENSEEVTPEPKGHVIALGVNGHHVPGPDAASSGSYNLDLNKFRNNRLNGTFQLYDKGMKRADWEFVSGTSDFNDNRVDQEVHESLDLDDDPYDVQKQINTIHLMDGVAFVAHPNSRLGISEDVLIGKEGPALKQYDGINVYNWTLNVGDGQLSLWQRLLKTESSWILKGDYFWGRAGMLSPAYAEDDYHPGGAAPFHGDDTRPGHTWMLLQTKPGWDAGTNFDRSETIKRALRHGRWVTYWTTDYPSRWSDINLIPKLNITKNESAHQIIVHSTHWLGALGSIPPAPHWWTGIKLVFCVGDTITDTDHGGFSTAGSHLAGPNDYVYVFDYSHYKGDLRWCYVDAFYANRGNLRIIGPPMRFKSLCSPTQPTGTGQHLLVDSVQSEPASIPDRGYVGGIYAVTTSDSNPIPSAGLPLELSFAGYDSSEYGPSSLAIYHFDPTALTWSPIGGSIDADHQSVTATIVQPGTYTVSSAAISDTQAPSISWLEPSERATCSGITTLSVNATDNVGVASVAFSLSLADGHGEERPIGTDDTATDGSWSESIDFTHYPAGLYTLRAQASDAAGNVASASRQITVASHPAAMTLQFNAVTTVTFDPDQDGFVLGGTMLSPEAPVVSVDVTFDGRGLHTGIEDNVANSWDCFVPGRLWSAGAHHLTVTLTDYFGNQVSNSTDYTLPLSAAYVDESPSSPVELGTPVTIKARTAGGDVSPSLLWTLAVSKDGGAWTTLSTDARYVWTPSAVGNYQLRITAQQGAMTKTATDVVVVVAPLTGVSLAPSIAGPQATGTLIKLVATPQGGALIEYSFVVDGVVVQDFASDNIFEWTPTIAGNHVITVTARTVDSQVKYSATIVYPVSGTLTDVQIQTVPANRQVTGQPVQLVGLSGGTSPEYRFELSTNGTIWTALRDFAADSTFQWTATSGSYHLRVIAREHGSSSQTTSGSISYSGIAPFSGVTLTVSPASPSGAGTSVQIAGAPIPGSAGPDQWKFEFKDSTSSVWSTIQDYDVSSSTNWILPYAGTFDLRVTGMTSSVQHSAQSQYIVPSP